MVRVKQENIPDHQYFHNSSQGVTIFRILLSACAHCRQNRCFNSPRRLTGRRNSPRRLARFEKGVLDVAHGDLRVPPPWTLFMISKKERGDSLSTSFNCLFCKVVPQEIGLMADTKIISHPCNRMRHRCGLMHLVTQSSPPVQNCQTWTGWWWWHPQISQTSPHELSGWLRAICAGQGQGQDGPGQLVVG